MHVSELNVYRIALLRKMEAMLVEGEWHFGGSEMHAGFKLCYPVL